MARVPRVFCESRVYHVVLRGNGRKIIFQEDVDYFIFRKLMFSLARRYGATIFTYCLMDNHVHILLKCEDLSKYMHDLGSGYASIYNSRYSFEGHLFQERFFSAPVTSERYFFCALRYILHNPETAGICSWEDYRFSNAKSFLSIRLSDSAWSLARVVGGPSALQDFLKDEDEDDAALKYEPDIHKRHPDSEARKSVNQFLQAWNEEHADKPPLTLADFPSVDKSTRNILLKKLLGLGIPSRQLSRITGIGRYIVDAAARSQ